MDFTLISNDVTLHSLRKASLKQRITDLFGKNLDKQLIPIDTDTSIVSINGFIGLPENARKRNALQYFMVNGRNMRHPYFHKAVMQCYEQLIPADEQPNYFINLRVDPETIDVNIHPTKNEIKFENEQPIWQILTAAIRESLGRFNAAPSIDFDVEDAPDIPVFAPDAYAQHEVQLDTAYNPFATPVMPKSTSAGKSGSRQSSFNSGSGDHLQNWEQLYDDFVKKRDDGYASMLESKLNNISGDDVISGETAEDKAPNIEMELEPAVSATLQLKNSYILTPAREGLMIIDQHRAHVRILYDTYIQKASEGAFVSQSTMFPDMLELSPAQNAVLTDIAPALEELGFNLSPLGDNTWSINGIPSILKDANPRDTLLSMIENVTETGEELASTLHEKIAISLAHSSAIKRGQPLTAGEMDRLISDLFRLPSPSLTPYGKPVFTILPLENISKLLG